MNEAMYVPVLKGKPGEFQAIKMLFPETVEGIIPFIDFPSVDLTPEGFNKVPLDLHLKSICDNLIASWGSDVYFDLLNVGLNDRVLNNVHPINYVFEYLLKRGLKPFPTVGLDRDDEYIDECKKILIKTDVNICLRLFEIDMLTYLRSSEALDSLIRTLNINGLRYEIMFDLRSVDRSNLFGISALVVRTISKMLDAGLGNTFIVVGCSFPNSLGNLKRNQVAELPRYEMDLWSDVYFKLTKKSVNLFFGDYGVVYWDFFDFKPKAMKNISAKIRYTTNDRWIISKGHKIKKNDAPVQ